ncbi:Amidohydrolase [uncultured Desulfobacterium sp.]|uniref:Amidohydrolase n=1 Tax=uncultured Desulfobacterium sp. TaxID=201089 RepID=A0A445MUC5_9BACT|nr:Amidohydrolase [uncultured Desulfobacterium sp.]
MTNSFIIQAGWLIDGTGRRPLQNVLLKVKDGNISSIGTSTGAVPHMPDILAMPDCTLVPGLIDSHVHLFMSGTGDPSIRQRQLNSPFEEMKDIILRHLYQQLSHGVVAVRDGGDYAGHALRYKLECMPLKSIPILVKSAGMAWHAPARYGDLIGRPPSQGLSLGRAIALSERNYDHVKLVNSGLNSLTVFGKESLPQFSRQELCEAVETAKGIGLKTMVHANGERPVREAIEAGCHSIEHGFFMGRDNLKRMAETGTIWVPTVYTMKAYSQFLPAGGIEKEMAEKNLEHQLEQISMASSYGVCIAAGSDCGSLGVHHGSGVKEEIALFVKAGMRIEEAIKCATLNSAKALGLEGELGNLSVGMPATLVAFRAEPPNVLEALERPEKIFVIGEQWRGDH